MHENTDDVEAAFGPAMEATTMVLSRFLFSSISPAQSHLTLCFVFLLQIAGRIGGRVLTFLSGLPSVGMGRLQNRENPKILGTSKEHEALGMADNFYNQAHEKFVKFQMCCDMFLCANEYIDVATFSHFVRKTGMPVSSSSSSSLGSSRLTPSSAFFRFPVFLRSQAATCSTTQGSTPPPRV
jgi:hypothetical protein